MDRHARGLQLGGAIEDAHPALRALVVEDHRVPRARDPARAGERGDVLDLVLGRRAVEVGDELDEPAVIAQHVEEGAELVVVGEA